MSSLPRVAALTRERVARERPGGDDRVVQRDKASVGLLLCGDRDQFGTPAQLEHVIQTVADPKKLVLIAGADHFFEGRLSEMRDAVQQWVPDAVSL